ncbi:S1C family serine protease [Hugenholtzia roseola]|uniref:S1C family serine protease n=1 Tax=Hugenholtzia roseola TaxID=1002 RepID=UPI00042191A2|nr:S1C family serine protease [Hugenholtzia roseola]
MMKKIALIVFALAGIFAFLVFSCSDNHKKGTAVGVVGQNGIKLKNGLVIYLLGVEGSEATATYLSTQVVGKDIKYRVDKGSRQRVTRQSEAAYAYVYVDRICINSLFLQKGITRLSTQYLKDSLQKYEKYAKAYQANNPAIAQREENEIESSGQLSFKDLVKKVRPSVFLVGNFRGENAVGQGTGFFVSADGKALSNEHVFAGGNRQEIKTLDGSFYEVSSILAKNSTKDFVYFQNSINSSVPHLPLTSQIPEVGEDIFVVGNPTGLESTVTRGVVSAIRKENGITYVQIDAAISPGSSGSPVLNMQGEVFGIATLKKIGCENCNFAVSIESIATEIGR